MASQDSRTHRSSTPALTLLALGIVFGDIGTSPLYAVKETFAPGHGIPLTAENILGGLSTIFWALMVVVSLKYVVLIMRADNRGEGGIMALIALASTAVKDHPQWRTPLLLIGVFGASLFYGDAVLTPAISVLSAVEGLEVGTSAFKPYVVPIAVVIIVCLFLFQSRGTAVVGRYFGPVTLLWFLSLGAAGVHGIAQYPGVVAALNPLLAIGFLSSHAAESFVVLGAVVLAVTGAEALYADMGHFGKGPVRLAWFGLVAPALVLNYFGQGALLIVRPEAVQNPFFLLLPGWALYPMVGLATAATVIASQATISGAYSMTKQAIQLGFLPRIAVVQTSARERGQIYIPAITWVLLAAVLAAVIGFGSSSRLASAYGVAVTATMTVDTLLTFFVIYYAWRLPLVLCLFATGFFVVVDVAFFSATLLKVVDGGWFPLAIGACVCIAMTTWRQGRGILFQRLRAASVPLKPFLDVIIVSGSLHVYISQTDRGELVMGASVDPFGSYSMNGSLSFLEDIAGHMLELFPSLAHVRVMRQWAGLCDMTPDYSPLMGFTPIDGFLIDAGWGTYGFKASPIVGKTMAELIATQRTPDLIAPFRLSRFYENDLVGEKGAASVGH